MVLPLDLAPSVEKDSESKVEPTQPQNPTPAMPKFRPAPMPIVRPARNFAEIEECKRVPAYITHGITLTTATKVHQISGVEKDQPAPESNMPALL